MQCGILLLFFGFLITCHGYQVFEKDCMGTKFIVLIDEDDEKKAEQGAAAAFKEGQRLNMVLSDYESASELFRFSESSGSGTKFALSDDLFRVLSHGQELSRQTNGSFDVTVGPFSRLWRIARVRKKMPSKEKLTSAKNRVGYENLRLSAKNRTGLLTTSGMALDLGGIAKGYAADMMLQTLRKKGLERCMIDAGGDLVVGSPPRGEKGWRVQIGGRKHPDLPTLHLSDVAVATSGDLEQFVHLNGKRYSHLINPVSGLGLTSQCQVTVIAPSGMEADSLASACLVLGLPKSKTLLEGKDGASAYYLRKDDAGTNCTQIGMK